MKLPDTFRLGIADADLQVIGEKHCLEKEGSQKTMWTHFSEMSGKVANGDSPLPGIDRYHRFEEDIGLIQQLGTSHYRTSVSMARLMTKDGSINPKAVAWYRNYFQLLKDKGVRIYATLYHWELPQFLAEQGGWANPLTIDFYLRHVKSVYETLGDLIDEYFLFNEPWVIGFVAHYLGIHAPGEKHLPNALKVIHNLLLAQGRGARLLKSLRHDLQVGTVYNLIPAYPADERESSFNAMQLADCYFNRWFLDPLYFGEYPQPLLERLEDKVPQFSSAEMDEIKVGNILDSFGINFYGGSLVYANPEHELGFEGTGRQYQFKNQLGWSMFIPPAYPWGLHELLLRTHARYERAGMRALYISENGTAWQSEQKADGTIDDEYRAFYVHQHLEQVLKSIKSGVPVRGYFLWTFMDNFEWAEGYRPEACFGIVHVDRETMQRTPKNSFFWLRDVLEKRVLFNPH